MFNLEKNLTVQSFLCHTEMLGHVSHVHLSGRGKCGNCKVKIQFSYESCYLFAKPVRSDWVVWVFVSCVHDEVMEYVRGAIFKQYSYEEVDGNVHLPFISLRSFSNAFLLRRLTSASVVCSIMASDNAFELQVEVDDVIEQRYKC